MLVARGRETISGIGLASAEVYDPATGIWSIPKAFGGTGIIQFRTREKAAAGAISTCDEHEATGEQRRGVEGPSIIEAACDRPISQGRIVQFRGRDRAFAANATCDQHLAIASAIAKPCWSGKRRL